MKKVVLIVAMLLMIPISVSAATQNVPYYGTTSINEHWFYANKYAGDQYIEYVEYTSETSDAEILYYEVVNGSSTFISSQSLSYGSNSLNLPSGINSIRLQSNDGSEVYLNYLEATTNGGTQVYFETSYNPDHPGIIVHDQNGGIWKSGYSKNKDGDGNDYYTKNIEGNSVRYTKYQYTDFNGQMITDELYDAADDGNEYTYAVHFRKNGNYKVTLLDENMNQLAYLDHTVTDLNKPDDQPYPGSSGENAINPVESPPDTGTGDCGCVVDIPRFDEMLTKLDEIKSAIPPEPNWQQVSETMRDTIVPAFRSEMEDMLGTAPEPPAPPVFNNPLTGGIDEPTGSLPADFEESGFTANDLKADAEEIQFKEDASGGFELLDPIGSLPTQEEFKQNIPSEQDLQAPEVPDVTGTAPEPPEQENIAPEPPDVTGTAPSPSEEDNIAPSPSEGENVAPTPGDTTGTAPLPGDDTGTAPVPSDDLTTAPLPSEDLTGAPIPNTE